MCVWCGVFFILLNGHEYLVCNKCTNKYNVYIFSIYILLYVYTHLYGCGRTKKIESEWVSWVRKRKQNEHKIVYMCGGGGGGVFEMGTADPLT